MRVSRFTVDCNGPDAMKTLCMVTEVVFMFQHFLRDADWADYFLVRSQLGQVLANEVSLSLTSSGVGITEVRYVWVVGR